MSVRVEVCIAGDGSEQRREILAIERRELAMETLGLTLSEGKALLAGVQDFVVAQQVQRELEQRRACPHCGQRHTTKDAGHTPVKTVFGQVQVPNPRWNRCSCLTDECAKKSGVMLLSIPFPLVLAAAGIAGASAGTRHPIPR